MAKPKIYVQPEVDCEKRRKFWADNGWEVDWLAGEGKDILQSKEADVMLVLPDQSLHWMELAKKVPIEIARIEFCDSLWLQEGRYWPRAMYKDLLRDFIVRIAKTLDISAWAYIAGDAAWAQMFVFLVSDIGYRKICLVGEDREAHDRIIAKCQRHSFGVEMRTSTPAELTQEANNGSLLVNTFDLEQHAELLQNLLYLNFIHRPGLVMDIVFNNEAGALLNEARQIGFEVISGADIRALYDFSLLEKLNVGPKTAFPEYLQKWREFLGGLKP